MKLQDILKEIKPLDQEWITKAEERTAMLVMPTRALGRLHDISERLCAIQKTMQPFLNRKAILVMAGDHGVVDEGVSAYPQEVTGAMVQTFLVGGAGIDTCYQNSGQGAVLQCERPAAPVVAPAPTPPPPPPPDSDGDGIIDALDLDSDNDGILDLWESGLTADQLELVDSDRDGVIDAGNAFDDANFDPEVGAGLGLKWRSPLGPIRFYLGYPVTANDKNVRFHLRLGADL